MRNQSGVASDSSRSGAAKRWTMDCSGHWAKGAALAVAAELPLLFFFFFSKCMTKDGLTCRGPLSHAEHARPVIRQNTVQNCADTCKLAAGHVTNPPELCDQAQQEMCPTSDQTSQHCHIAGFGCRCFPPDWLFLKMKTQTSPCLAFSNFFHRAPSNSQKKNSETDTRTHKSFLS